MRSPAIRALCWLVLAAPAFAQDTEETPPAETPAEAPPKAKEKEKKAPPAADEPPAAPPGMPQLTPISQGPEKDLAFARASAKRFFGDLLVGDARELVTVDCALPFYVEDRKYGTHEELLQEWLRNLRDKRTDLLTLYGIEMLTPQEMEKKYGKPPARLANFPWHGAHTYLAVANLSGHAGVAVVQLGMKGWRVIGYHD